MRKIYRRFFIFNVGNQKIEIRNNEALAEEFKTQLGDPVFRDAGDIDNKTKVVKVLKAVSGQLIVNPISV